MAAKTALQKRMAKDAKSTEIPADKVKQVRALAMKLVAKQNEIDAIEVKLKALVVEATELSQVAIPTLLADELQLSELVLDDGTRIKVGQELYPHVLKQNLPRFYAWLGKMNCDGIIKNELKVAFSKGDEERAGKLYDQLYKKLGEAVSRKRFIHPQTFAAFIKERVTKGAALPAIVNLNAVRVTKVERK